jgi:hypothetical protein
MIAVRLAEPPDRRPAPQPVLRLVAWSRLRAVIPTWDRSPGAAAACLGATLRRLSGSTTYLLIDNAKTVTIEHVAGRGCESTPGN